MFRGGGLGGGGFRGGRQHLLGDGQGAGPGHSGRQLGIDKDRTAALLQNRAGGAGALHCVALPCRFGNRIGGAHRQVGNFRRLSGGKGDLPAVLQCAGAACRVARRIVQLPEEGGLGIAADAHPEGKAAVGVGKAARHLFADGQAGQAADIFGGELHFPGGFGGDGEGQGVFRRGKVITVGGGDFPEEILPGGQLSDADFAVGIGGVAPGSRVPSAR